MRIFRLVRKQDIHGVSGTGVVAEGVEWHDGQVNMSWYGHYHSNTVFPNIQTLIAIHGHGGLTYIEWIAAFNPRKDNRKIG